MKPCLFDTGPIIVFLDQDDVAHREVTEALAKMTGRFVTTSAVVVEAMYLAQRFSSGARRVVDFLHGAKIQTIDSCQIPFLRRAVTLMEKYEDTPMDFADASLVVLAEDLSTDQICTLDRRGFSVFRTARGKRFSLVLDRVA